MKHQIQRISIKAPFFKVVFRLKRFWEKITVRSSFFIGDLEHMLGLTKEVHDVDEFFKELEN